MNVMQITLSLIKKQIQRICYKFFYRQPSTLKKIAKLKLIHLEKKYYISWKTHKHNRSNNNIKGKWENS